MAQEIAETAYLVPGLVRYQIDSLATEPNGSFTNPLKAAFDRIADEVIGFEFLL